MSLYSISGVGCYDDKPGYIGGKRKAKRQQKRTARKAKRTARKAARKERKSGVNCKGAKVKSIALAPARNAYLALIKLNVKKLAVKLAKATSTQAGKKKIQEKWCKLGGDGAKLQRAIDSAYAKYKRKRGVIGYMDTDQLNIIGFAPAAALAAAAPVIKALAPLIKQLAPESKAAEAAETAEAVTEATESGESESESEQQTQQSEESESADVSGIGVNPYLLGAGALAAYFLFFKRK